MTKSADFTLTTHQHPGDVNQISYRIFFCRNHVKTYYHSRKLNDPYRAPVVWRWQKDVIRAWFNIKMSYQFRKSHCGDKTVIRLSYLHNGISYTGKMASLYWTNPLADSIQEKLCQNPDAITQENALKKICDGCLPLQHTCVMVGVWAQGFTYSVIYVGMYQHVIWN